MNDFTTEIEGLYNDFARRIDGLNWEELLDNELNINLTTVDVASEQMLEFLMKQNNLPLEVWRIFEDKFGWSCQKEELKLSYPPAFIDYVIKQVTGALDNDIKFHLFDTSIEKDFDRFILLIREVARYLDYRSLKGVESFVEELENFGIDHPDYLMEKARILAVEGKPDEGLELLYYIFDTYTEDYEASVYFKFVHAFVLATFSEQDKLEEAIFFFEELLELSPDDVTSKDGLADCYERIGHLDKAYQFTMDHILAGIPSDNYALQRMQLLSEKLLPIYQEKYESGEATEEDILELTKYYRQTGKKEEAFELLQDNPQLDHLSKYHRMLANLYAVSWDSENAINYALQSIQIEPSIFAYDTLIHALVAERRFEEALEAIKAGAKLPAEGYDRVGKALLLDAKARIFYRMKEYDNALIASDEALKVHDKVAHLYNTRAEILTRMNNLQEGMNNAIKSQHLLPYSIVPYEIQAEIYYLAYRIDEVLNVIKQAEQFQLPIADKLAYYNALTLRDKAQKENTDLQPILDMLLELEQSETFTQLDKHLPEEGLFAKLLGQIAYTFWSKKEDDHALQYILRAIDEANEFIEEDVVASWYDFQASILETLKKQADALEVCIEVLKKFPNYLPLLKRAGRLHSNNKNYEETLKLFTRAYEIDQEDDLIYDWLEYAYRMLEHNEKAIQISKKWVTITGSINAYCALAWHYKQMNELDLQLQTLQNALLQHPNNETLLMELAFYYGDQKAFQKAIELCKQVLELNPDNPNIRINLAYHLTCLGKHDEALEVVDIGLEKEANKVAYHVRRALIFIDAKKHEAAISAYEMALEKVALDPDIFWTEAKINNRLGLIYSTRLNAGKVALEYQHKAVQLEPSDASYLEQLAFLYECYKKDYSKALDLYEQSAQKKETTYALWGIGDMHEKLGDRSKASVYYERALDIHEIKPVADHNDYTTQAGLLIALGKCDNALKYLKQAEETMKSDGRNSCGACACVYRTWAKYYLKLNRLKEALVTIDHALTLENSVGGHSIKDEVLKAAKWVKR